MSFHFAPLTSGTFSNFLPVHSSYPLPRRTIVRGPAMSANGAPQVITEPIFPIPSLRMDRPRWAIALDLSAQEVRNLRPGWDGPGSGTVSDDVINRAVALTRAALVGLADPCAPYLMPAGDGSLQIEWDSVHAKLEFCLEPDGSIDFWSRDLCTGEEREGEGADALALFRHWAPWAAQTIDADHERNQEDLAVFELAA